MLKNWCFWTVVLQKTLEIPWTARRSNYSILKEISPQFSLEGLMLKLYFSHLMRKADIRKRHWCWEWLKAGGEGEDRGWDGWMASPTQWTWVLVNSGIWWWTGRCGVLQSMGSKELDMTKWLNWTPAFRQILYHCLSHQGSAYMSMFGRSILLYSRN